ncbi:DUF1398 domain-containing protein [Bdellovibrio sp. SKB1291214]|uniref:DUF1398 family protein n=1 Tax=Bdellovibrio sp. SKB1291214 TaxID=1732569 RepID=UPI000B518611|nr:DUF1398 family protein [Bdellovibrio sp. SKB1291214]UYL10305.1 DUF1398 domain-containing protein [Bdellovibrio sp. SKB1291214]
MNFSEFISTLEETLVDYCRVDLLEGKMIFVVEDGDIYSDNLDLKGKIADQFDDGGIRQAILENHLDRLTFKDFVKTLMECGVVSYTIHLSGRKVIYFGKHGDCVYENLRSKPDAVRPPALGTSTVQ